MLKYTFVAAGFWKKKSIVTAFFVGVLFAPSVWAEKSATLNVRAQAQESFSRLSFDWSKSIPYTLQIREDNTVHLRFEKTLLPRKLPNTSHFPDYVESLTAGQEGEDLVIILRLKKGSKVRKFEVKDGLLVDVLPPSIPEKASQESKKKTEKPTEKPSASAPFSNTPLQMRLLENKNGHTEFVFGSSKQTQVAVLQRGNILLMAFTYSGGVEAPSQKKLEKHNIASFEQSSPIPSTLLIKASFLAQIDGLILNIKGGGGISG
ncbi:MAG: hypothetical protein GY915_02125 [bacterium]|nr:hypothetical protein [bacterium]